MAVILTTDTDYFNGRLLKVNIERLLHYRPQSSARDVEVGTT